MWAYPRPGFACWRGGVSVFWFCFRRVSTRAAAIRRGGRRGRRLWEEMTRRQCFRCSVSILAGLQRQYYNSSTRSCSLVVLLLHLTVVRLTAVVALHLKQLTAEYGIRAISADLAADHTVCASSSVQTGVLALDHILVQVAYTTRITCLHPRADSSAFSVFRAYVPKRSSPNHGTKPVRSQPVCESTLRNNKQRISCTAYGRGER